MRKNLFENSKNSPAAMKWFEQLLGGQGSKFDPNAMLSHDYYRKMPLLVHALEAGNSQAALLLLQHGASPHPYQDLWLTTPSVPRFLFPFNDLAENAAFTKEEKAALAKAYYKAGAVFVHLKNSSDNFWITSQLRDMELVVTNAKLTFGFQLEETPTIIESKSSIIAEAAAERTGFDWGSYVKSLPTLIMAQESGPYRPDWFELVDLIGIYEEKAYFLAIARRDYFLVEISKDKLMWHLYMHIDSFAGGGHAKGSQYDARAWRRWSLRFSEEERSFMLNDYYPYQGIAESPSERVRRHKLSDVGLVLADNGSLFPTVRPRFRWPASEAGVMDGDRLREVNGKSVSGMSLTSIQKLLTGEGESVVHLVVDRRGQTIGFDVARKPLISLTAPQWFANPDKPHDGQQATFDPGKSLFLEGVTLTDLDAETRSRYGYEEPFYGAVVVSVAPGTGAASAGLQEGDLILEVDSVPIFSVREALTQGNLSSKDKLVLRVGSMKRSRMVIFQGEQ